MSDKLEIYINDESFLLDAFDAVAIAEGFEEADSHEQRLAAWQYLELTGITSTLQGFFGRGVEALVRDDHILSAAAYKAQYAIVEVVEHEDA